MNSEGIQKKLLGERALAIAQESEEADRNLRGPTDKHSSMTIKQEPVHQLQTSYQARNTEGKRREPRVLTNQATVDSKRLPVTIASILLGCVAARLNKRRDRWEEYVKSEESEEDFEN